MNKKNLIPPATLPISPLTAQNLSVELVELFEEDLQQIVGGIRIIDDVYPGYIPLLPPCPRRPSFFELV